MVYSFFMHTKSESTNILFLDQKLSTKTRVQEFDSYANVMEQDTLKNVLVF